MTKIFKPQQWSAQRTLLLQDGNVKLNEQHARRELTSDELTRQFEATRHGRMRKPLTGEQRFLLYATAVGTGLRASELASLTPGHFDLDTEMPTVRINAGDEKARRGAELPLNSDLVELLRPYLVTLDADARLWPGSWTKQKRAGLWMKADLKIGRKAWIAEAEKSNDPAEKSRREQSDFLTYQDSEGRFADFHALRHTFISRVGRAKVSLKEMMTLARHTTPQMTMRYTHANLYDLASAVNQLPRLSPDESESKPEPAAIRTTGTDDSRLALVARSRPETPCERLTKSIR